MERVSKFTQLIRPVNCLMMGFAVIVGALLAKQESFSSPSLANLIFGFVTSFTLTGASMAVNDYYDREIDAVNEPNRPIPSGVIKPGEALVFASILTVIGFTTAFMTNISCLITAVIAWLVFIVYTTKGKRTGLPGNFLVSLCIAIPFLYGGFTVANQLEFRAVTRIALFAAMAFFSNTGREVTKGIVDVMGDKSKGVRTVAIV
ncbi:MAG: geranylgeranylglycerol-phosphate geranylgeranyltransferase, partial [Thermoproteota archaeon]|nr:geranylgeranylglycerol-phosphate geranylgeranyltransferase [Thermoproteota archaeon]